MFPASAAAGRFNLSVTFFDVTDASLVDRITGRSAKAGSHVMFAFARKAAQENVPSIEELPPFHYRDWISLHHGEIYGALGSIVLRDSQPQGGSGSERLMLSILELMVVSMNPTPRRAGV